MEALLYGVRTRKVEDLMKSLGADTRVSRPGATSLNADLHGEVAATPDRSLTETTSRYVFLTVTY